MHDDLSDQVHVMRTAAAVLVRYHCDNRLQALVAHHIGVLDIDIRCMPNHGNMVFVLVVIGDDIDPETVHPMVVQFVVLARDSGPVDRAIRLDVLFNDVQFCIQLRGNEEGILSCAADQDVVTLQGLIGVGGQLLQVQIHLTIGIFPRRHIYCQLSDTLYACVRPRDQQIVSVAAIQKVRTAPAIQHVISVATAQDVVPIAAH